MSLRPNPFERMRYQRRWLATLSEALDITTIVLPR
jgi:hypothetical protein